MKIQPKTAKFLLISSAAVFAAAAILLYASGRTSLQLIFAFFSSACITLCAHFAKDTAEAKKYIIAACVVYTAGILFSTVIKKDVSFLFPLDGKELWVKDHLLLKPFENIRAYCRMLYSSEFLYGFTNLFGNLLVFTPFALFLPKIFKKANTRGGFFAMMLGFLLIVETGELLLMCGFFETDDILLNLGGTWVAYELMQGDGSRNTINEKLHLEEAGTPPAKGQK